jgi:succinyl-CoA synthetase beta subunit
VPWPEQTARELLAEAGIPVVPGRLASSAGEAVAAARDVGLPVAMKTCAAGITHKSDIGGVALWLNSDEDVHAAYARVTSAAAAAKGTVPAGSTGAAALAGSAAADTVGQVLVTAMRTGGVEVLAGVSVDAGFGPVLAVGLGGVFVEVLHDVSLRVLPVDPAGVEAMLGELRGFPLLTGARGGIPAELAALSRVISDIGQLACSVPGLQVLEVNPLWVHGEQVEALDALVVTDNNYPHGLEMEPGR